MVEESMMNITALFPEMENSLAFLTAVVALITAIVGIVFNYWNLKNEKEKWLTDARSQLQSHYLEGIVGERLRTYAPVFKTLGEVRDVPDPQQEHWNTLKKNPEKLLRVADELLSHLYGEAGLLMEMNTRNSLLTAYYSCHKFQNNEIKLERLVSDFYQARRKLRADLQIPDLGEETELKHIIESYSNALPI